VTFNRDVTFSNSGLSTRPAASAPVAPKPRSFLELLSYRPGAY
jgi:hypothetical protein